MCQNGNVENTRIILCIITAFPPTNIDFLVRKQLIYFVCVHTRTNTMDTYNQMQLFAKLNTNGKP
jgi:hypothetical protein